MLSEILSHVSVSSGADDYCGIDGIED